MPAPTQKEVLAASKKIKDQNLASLMSSWDSDPRFSKATDLMKKSGGPGMFDATPEKEKKARDAGKPEVNNWQKLGGLVMSADRPLNNIEKNTRKAADALDAIKKGGGFSATKPKETIF